VRALIVSAAIALAGGTALASTPAEDLAEARDEFRAGKYKAVIGLLNPILYPTPKLARTRDLVEAYVLLGVAQYESGDPKGATREVEAALYLDGSYSLDEQLFSEQARRFFDETKAAKEARDRAADDARAAAEKAEQLQKTIDSMRFVERRPYWVNFMPFGAGQFQNGDTKKGIFFAGTEAAAAGTSLVIFAYLTNKYGFGGQVPREDAADVRRLQQVSIGATVVFYGVAIVGVIDALRNYKAQAEIKFDEDLLPEDIRRQLRENREKKDQNGDDPKPRPRVKLTPPAARLHIHPLPFPDGAGVGLTWEH
jgi:hypothetical protein